MKESELKARIESGLFCRKCGEKADEFCACELNQGSAAARLSEIREIVDGCPASSKAWLIAQLSAFVIETIVSHGPLIRTPSIGKCSICQKTAPLFGTPGSCADCEDAWRHWDGSPDTGD